MNIVNNDDVLSYDDRGNLIEGCHNCSINDFKNKFLDEFPESITRKSRMDLFLKFISNLNKNTNCVLHYWINGGFTTNKENPCDVDFVIVVDNEKLTDNDNYYLSNLIEEINNFRNDYKTLENDIQYDNNRSKRELMETDFYKKCACDAYILIKRKVDDPLYNLYIENKNYWTKWWGHTREDENGQSFSKGFVNINYDNSIIDEEV
ncbi:MAG: hypothetical protein LBM96_12160 [Methanobrevibacter sp.]|jgi:hypothetical protein|nr:hypothetical protein [Candidatus Methanoflexus mossambicus]